MSEAVNGVAENIFFAALLTTAAHAQRSNANSRHDHIEGRSDVDAVAVRTRAATNQIYQFCIFSWRHINDVHRTGSVSRISTARFGLVYPPHAHATFMAEQQHFPRAIHHRIGDHGRMTYVVKVMQSDASIASLLIEA
jgi:hypothetical protein